MLYPRSLSVFLSIALLVLAGCGQGKKKELSAGTPTGKGEREVVVYTALDREFSDPILKEFEAKTGIKVKPVYDTEATKTTGMVNRIIAEKDRPQCDVFWNNEIVRTIKLKSMGLLQPYASPSAKDIPPFMKDAEGFWTGFAARGRVLIYNTEKVKSDAAPRTLAQLANFGSQAGIAKPLFGTTSTHVAVLFATHGAHDTQQLLMGLKAKGVTVCSGNASVCNDVVAGRLSVGLTDTDDAHVALLKKSPIAIVYPDQDGAGMLLIPNSVSIVKNCPHLEEAKQLVDFLLSKEVEAKLAACPSAQIPVRPDVPGPIGLTGMDKVKRMEVDFTKAAEQLEPAAKFVSEEFLK